MTATVTITANEHPVYVAIQDTQPDVARNQVPRNQVDTVPPHGTRYFYVSDMRSLMIKELTPAGAASKQE